MSTHIFDLASDREGMEREPEPDCAECGDSGIAEERDADRTIEYPCGCAAGVERERARGAYLRAVERLGSRVAEAGR